MISSLPFTMKNLILVSSILAIITWMSPKSNRNFCLAQTPVVPLTDATFEHQTQASTGSTTGSWLVLFYSSEEGSCPDCPSIQSALEQLMVRSDMADSLYEKGIVLGEVNIVNNPQTTTRFDISRTPTVLYIHKGSYYTLPSSSLSITTKRTTTTTNEDGAEEINDEEVVVDLESLTKRLHSFVMGGFLEQDDVEGIPIPALPTLFVQLEETVIHIWEEYYALAILGMIILMFGTGVMSMALNAHPQRMKRD